MSAVIELRDVKVTFDSPQGPVHALRGVSLTVEQGEVLALVGESGAGKSTLVRALLGLGTRFEGSIRIGGVPWPTTDRAAAMRVRRAMQPVLQDPSASLDPRQTVGDAIAEPMAVHSSVARSERPERVKVLLEAVGLLPEHAARRPAELSAGQRQRVNIARALALEPSVLLLDEPVSALDVSVQAQVLNLLMSLKKQRGLSYLFITHALDVALHVADRVAVLYAGQIVEEGPATQVMSAPRHPYTQMLASGRAAGSAPAAHAWPSGCAFHPRCPHVMDRCRTEQPALDAGVACFLPK